MTHVRTQTKDHLMRLGHTAFLACAIVSCSNEKDSPIIGGQRAPSTSHSQLKERWDDKNAPINLEWLTAEYPRYTLRYKDLPLSGEVPKDIWQMSYVPTYLGGGAYRWNEDEAKGTPQSQVSFPLLTREQVLAMSLTQLASLSPAEKYDIYLGRYDFPTVQAEHERTGVLKTVPGTPVYDSKESIPRWFGLCHAAAPNSVNLGEPAPVTISSLDGKMQIPFGSADLKILAAMATDYNGGRATRFLGTRCDFEGTKLMDLVHEFHRGGISFLTYMAKKKACEDVNAGSVHAVLTNDLGLQKQAVIADISGFAPVWNYVVRAYVMEEGKVVHRASRGAAPGTVEERDIHAKIFYVPGGDNTWEKTSPEDKSLGEIELDYRVELDANGTLLGGEWYTPADKRLDFLWKEKVDPFRGHFAPLKTIYNASLEPAPQPLRAEETPRLTAAPAA